jgi:hypothetical protein
MYHVYNVHRVLLFFARHAPAVAFHRVINHFHRVINHTLSQVMISGVRYRACDNALFFFGCAAVLHCAWRRVELLRPRTRNVTPYLLPQLMRRHVCSEPQLCC